MHQCLCDTFQWLYDHLLDQQKAYLETTAKLRHHASRLPLQDSDCAFLLLKFFFCIMDKVHKQVSEQRNHDIDPQFKPICLIVAQQQQKRDTSLVSLKSGLQSCDNFAHKSNNEALVNK